MKTIKHLDLVLLAILFPLGFYLDRQNYTGTAPSIIIIIIALACIIFASERFLDAAKALALKARIPEVIIGLTIVSIGTSLPEIASSGMASYTAKLTGDFSFSDLALGNIYGSVLVQITVILGIVILFSPMHIDRDSVRRDGVMMIVAVLILTIFILSDGILGMIESIVLIAIYTFYIIFLLRARKKMNLALDEEAAKEAAKPSGELVPEPKGSGADKDEDEKVPVEKPVIIYLLIIAGTLAIVVLSSGFLVNAGIAFAEAVGVAGGVVGLTISSVGTSLPELAVALVAVKAARGLSIGALIGSNVTDPLLSIGVAGAINPIELPAEGMVIFQTITVPMTIIACVVSVIFMWTKWELERWEGTVLIVVYAVFLGLLLIPPLL